MAGVTRLCLELLVILWGVLATCVQLDKNGINMLDSVLSDYDTLHTSHLTHTVHSHSRRIYFSTLGREFELRLEPNMRFASNFAAHSVDANNDIRPFHVDQNQFYTGHVHGEDGSRVTAHVSSDGVLSAHITTPTETYHIEPSRHYITDPHSYHMIAYRGSQVKDRLSDAKVDYNVAPSILDPESHSEQFQFHSTQSDSDSNRLKRQATVYPGRIGGDSCSVYLIADYTVFELLMDKNSVANRMIQLVLAIDREIYRDTGWIIDTTGRSVNNLGLFIGGVLIHESSNATDNHYATPLDLEAGEILGRMRFFDWSEFCLAHLFVNRNFPSRLLGLANIASPSISQTGGICSTRFRDNSFPGKPLVIYNTGLTTLLNRGQQMLQAELVRVTGHELGHNWGSHHDTRTCGPGWLMNEYAQDGSKPTHTMFSSCSSTSIGQVLLSKGSCFDTIPDVMCGDYRVQGDEKCDVGDVANDICCTTDCTLRNDTFQCSDQNSPCCQDCMYLPDTTVCRLEGEITFNCVTSTFCTGTSGSCPVESPLAPDNAPCINGECRNNGASSTCVELCVSRDMMPCECSMEEQCLLCCNDTNGTCAPLLKPDDSIITLSNGASCDTGFCFEGNCSRGAQDEITRIWTIIVTLDVNAFAVLLRGNLIGCILFLTLLLWCPISCCVHHCHDQPLWARFSGSRDETDLGAWYTERMNTYQRYVNQTPASEGGKKFPLKGISEEEVEPLMRSSSPVDTGPPPIYS